MIFRDREEAGRLLGRTLARRALERPAVLAIPRGGVPVGAEVARAIGAELGVVVARKIGAPGRSELAIGAVTATGEVFIDERLAYFTGADRDYVAATAEREIAEARRREQLFATRRLEIERRDVIVVDDGIATGSTVLAAVRSIRALGARRVIVATPVASPRTLERIAREVDDVVCLEIDDDFNAVGSYYERFNQIEDGDVKSILDDFGARAPSIL